MWRMFPSDCAHCNRSGPAPAGVNTDTNLSSPWAAQAGDINPRLQSPRLHYTLATSHPSTANMRKWFGFLSLLFVSRSDSRRRANKCIDLFSRVVLKMGYDYQGINLSWPCGAFFNLPVTWKTTVSGKRNTTLSILKKSEGRWKMKKKNPTVVHHVAHNLFIAPV